MTKDTMRFNIKRENEVNSLEDVFTALIQTTLEKREAFCAEKAVFFRITFISKVSEGVVLKTKVVWIH